MKKKKTGDCFVFRIIFPLLRNWMEKNSREYFFFHLIPFFCFSGYFFSVKFKWNTFEENFSFMCEIKWKKNFFFAEFFLFQEKLFYFVFQENSFPICEIEWKKSQEIFFSMWDRMKKQLVGDFFSFSEEFFFLEAVKYFFSREMFF